jgi:cytochrome P450
MAQASTKTAEKRVPACVPPGPRGHWFRGSLRALQSDPLNLYRQCQREYGDVVRLRTLPGLDVYLLFHPEAVEHVLVKHHRNYGKPGFFPKKFGLLAGNGLLSSSGEFWLRQRRLMQPAFHRDALAKLAPRMVSAAEDCVQHWLTGKTDQPRDMLAEMTRLSLRIAGDTLFGADIAADADQIGAAYRIAFAYVSYRLNYFPLAPVWWPTVRNREFAQAKRLLDDTLRQIITERRQSISPPDDLLSTLLAAQDEHTGRRMSDQQLLDELLTLLTAGHETIAAALTWTWILLARHPTVHADLADELRSVLGDRMPTLDDLPRLPLTRAVFDEALRLYPPAWGQTRRSVEADEIGGFAIPRRSFVVVSQWITHRHPAFWSEPDEFRPERFLHPDPRRPRFAYFPFGGGPRMCIGNTFALLEGPLVLATIANRFRVELAANQTIDPDTAFALRPRGPVLMYLRPR